MKAMASSSSGVQTLVGEAQIEINHLANTTFQQLVNDLAGLASFPDVTFVSTVNNAFNLTMARELERFFLTDARSDDVRAVVVTGAGRAFCAGMDLSREGNVFGLDESLAGERERSLAAQQALRHASIEVARALIRGHEHVGVDVQQPASEFD